MNDIPLFPHILEHIDDVFGSDLPDILVFGES
jgi:hypothetical protein